MTPGRLVLVPNALDLGAGEVPLADVLPAGVIRLAASLRHWAVEDARSARAFLKRVAVIEPLAAPLQAICAAHDVAFIVNDSVSLAKRLKADGVHLGQDDGSPREAREELGREAQIGVTCHASRHMAMDAGEAGADYVAFGAFYPSTTKDKGPDAEVPDLDVLEWWSQIFEIPCVAIGGITPNNCAPLILAGADFLAVSGAVWGGDEVAAVEAFAEAMKAASIERKRILASRR